MELLELDEFLPCFMLLKSREKIMVDDIRIPKGAGASYHHLKNQ